MRSNGTTPMCVLSCISDKIPINLKNVTLSNLQPQINERTYRNIHQMHMEISWFLAIVDLLMHTRPQHLLNMVKIDNFNVITIDWKGTPVCTKKLVYDEPRNWFTINDKPTSTRFIFHRRAIAGNPLLITSISSTLSNDFLLDNDNFLVEIFIVGLKELFKQQIPHTAYDILIGHGDICDAIQLILGTKSYPTGDKWLSNHLKLKNIWNDYNYILVSETTDNVRKLRPEHTYWLKDFDRKKVIVRDPYGSDDIELTFSEAEREFNKMIYIKYKDEPTLINVEKLDNKIQPLENIYPRKALSYYIQYIDIQIAMMCTQLVLILILLNVKAISIYKYSLYKSIYSLFMLPIITIIGLKLTALLPHVYLPMMHTSIVFAYMYIITHYRLEFNLKRLFNSTNMMQFFINRTELCIIISFLISIFQICTSIISQIYVMILLTLSIIISIIILYVRVSVTLIFQSVT